MEYKENQKVMIFRKDIETQNGTMAIYSYGISNKNQDGTYSKTYRQCIFKKGVELQNKQMITIKKAFEKPKEYKLKDGTIKKDSYAFILDFDEIGESTDQLVQKAFSQPNKTNDPFAEFGETVSVDDDYLE